MAAFQICESNAKEEVEEDNGESISGLQEVLSLLRTESRKEMLGLEMFKGRWKWLQMDTGYVVVLVKMERLEKDGMK